MLQSHTTQQKENTRSGGLRASTPLLPRAMPWSSVRGLIASGFGLLVFILAVVTVAAAWQVSRHQADLEELELHSNRAALIQNVETQGSIAGLLLQRYVDTGGDTYPAEINAHVTAAASSLQEILNKPDPPAEFERVSSIGLTLMRDAARAAELRRIGNVDAARLVLEDMVPTFRDYRLTLEAMTADELAQVAELRRSANHTGQLAFWLIVASGTLGVIFGLVVSVLIARTIIRPLGSLEGTAAAVSGGDLGARASVTRPRELASLGRTLNDMMTTLQARNQELEERNRQLTDARALASTDGLTGIFNHRTFQEHIRALVDEADAAAPLSLLMLDIDFFKQINDSLGHQKGDEILRACTETCAAIAGDGAVYRYGGDEIAVVLAGKSLLEAERVGEGIRATIAENSGQTAAPVTISVGVASYPATATSAEELIYRADAAMYAAKSSGKNRVRRWDEIGWEPPEGAAGAVGLTRPATSRAE